VVRRSEFKDNIKVCPFHEQASCDNDNCMIHDSEQVTRCRLNAYCSSDGSSADRQCDSGGEELMTNNNVRTVHTASRLGRNEEGKVCNTESATDSHNAITDYRAITTDQIRELINELENSALTRNKN